MFSRILIPVDLSARNRRTLEAAADLVRAGGGSALILHVIEEIEDVPAAELEDFYRDLRARAEAALAELRADLEKRGVAVETRVRSGRRWSEIVECAEAEGCDLVLLRSHVLDPSQPLRGFGTISHQVALAARCAVLLVR